MNKFFKNWKTTSTGLVMCIGAVALYLNDKTQLLPAVTAFLAGVGFIFSADSETPAV